MATTRLTLKTNRSLPEVMRVLRRLPDLISRDTIFLTKVGLLVLERIRDDFIVKSKGGTGAAGIRWAPLSPMTVAYKRKHPLVTKNKVSASKRLPRSSTRSGYAPSYALTTKERTRWWSLYRKFTHVYKGDKGHAAAAAWVVLKASGARTLFGLYAYAPADILHDTGQLLLSLTPAASPSSNSSSPPKSPLQVFRIGKGEVIVGTRRPFALAHHLGNPARNLPRRQLWPEPAKWPQEWWDDIKQAAVEAVIRALQAQL